MTRTTASTIYHVCPPMAGMILQEGAWTDDDTRKLGGYFAAPLDKDKFVSIGTADMSVTLSGAAGEPIGKLVSEPQGPHVENGRQGTVMLFGTHIMEVEMHTLSDSVALGGSVQFSTSGGVYAEGLWAVDSTASDNMALAAYTTGSAAGTTIPVLFGVVHY